MEAYCNPKQTKDSLQPKTRPKDDLAADFMKLEDGEYIEDEQELSLDQFYAATQEMLTQNGLADQIGGFDVAELQKLLNKTFRKNSDGTCSLDLSSAEMIPTETQKALLMLL